MDNETIGKTKTTSTVSGTHVLLDSDAVSILNAKREEIKSEGKSGITYSDVVRWLAVKAGIREGTM